MYMRQANVYTEEEEEEEEGKKKKGERKSREIETAHNVAYVYLLLTSILQCWPCGQAAQRLTRSHRTKSDVQQIVVAILMCH